MDKDKVKWLYYAIDIAVFIVLFLTVGWIIAFIVSVIVGFLLQTLDPLSKTSE